MMKLSIVRQVLADAWRAIRMNFLGSRRDHYDYIHPTATVLMPSIINKRNVRLYEHTNIGEHANIMANKGKFIMKKYSIAGPGLTVICQNHNMFEVGSYPGDNNWRKGEIPADVIVEDGVWLGAHVTLCPGAHVGRGCIVAAGAVVTGNIPPYTIVGGVPAKVIKKRFSIEEIMEHERRVLPEEERFSRGFIDKVFQTYNEIS